MIGYWREEAGRKCALDKHNPNYGRVELGHPVGWFLVGTITKIVEAPLSRSQSG